MMGTDASHVQSVECGASAAIDRKPGMHPAAVRKFATASSADDLIAKTDQCAVI
jgi:hypothetical protein